MSEFDGKDIDLSELNFGEDLGVDPNASSYDLLPTTSLTDTTAAFNAKIQQKKKEQELAIDAAKKETHIRQISMLYALMNMRRSLREVTRINMGERFSFLLQEDDYGGWPRLTLLLKDENFPEREYPFLKLTAHDRNSLGVVEIVVSTEEKPTRIMFNQESTAVSYPKLLRRSVRLYLDKIEEVILKAEDQSELEAQNALVELLAQNSFDEDGRPIKQITDNIFSEDIESDLFETLPVLDNLDTISEEKKQ